MSMSTYVEGFKPADEKWERMNAIWQACKAENIRIPEEVQKYFEAGNPDPTGVRVRLEGKKYNNHYQDGIEIDITELSPDIKIIRFINSY